MKKVVFSFLCFGLAAVTYAQDLKTAKSELDKKQYDKAKTDIDAYVAKNPDDAEGLYYKAKIYEGLAGSDQFKNLAPDALDQAFDAAKKAMGDGKDPKITLIAMKDQYAGIFDLYTAYYQAGAASFNVAAKSSDKATFATAMNEFIKSDSVGQYIARNGWSKLPAVDTVLVLNIGKAALNAGKDDITLPAFKQLADANIAGTKDGDNASYQLPYQWLMLHYKDAKDEANMKKYAELGKKLFPSSDYYDLVMIDYYKDKKNYEDEFATYNTVVTKHPDSLAYHFNYANDIFGYLYNGDEGVVLKNKDSLTKVMGAELEKAHSLDGNDVLTNWLYAQYYYNQGIDLRDASLKIKSTKPDDVKKKNDLTAQSKDMFNKAIPYGEKGLSVLEANGYKKVDRSHYKSIVDLMEKTYQSLNMNDKVKQYDAMYDGADKKFVN